MALCLREISGFKYGNTGRNIMNKITFIAALAALALPFGALPTDSAQARSAGQSAGGVIATGMASFYGARAAKPPTVNALIPTR